MMEKMHVLVLAQTFSIEGEWRGWVYFRVYSDQDCMIVHVCGLIKSYLLFACVYCYSKADPQTSWRCILQWDLPKEVRDVYQEGEFITCLDLHHVWLDIVINTVLTGMILQMHHIMVQTAISLEEYPLYPCCWNEQAFWNFGGYL